jgi:hypothetical protein
MSAGVKDFIEGYISNNINAEGYPPEGDNSSARHHAGKLAEAAKLSGITMSQLEDETGGDLEGYIATAIEDANDGEVERLVAKDD